MEKNLQKVSLCAKNKFVCIVITEKSNITIKTNLQEGTPCSQNNLVSIILICMSIIRFVISEISTCVVFMFWLIWITNLSGFEPPGIPKRKKVGIEPWPMEVKPAIMLKNNYRFEPRSYNKDNIWDLNHGTCVVLPPTAFKKIMN